jgi:hypothetical protein
MDAYRSGHRVPIWPLVRQHLWPVAAAGLLGLFGYGGALVEHARAGSVEKQLATVEEEFGRAATMRIEMEQLNLRAKYLRRFDTELTTPPVHELLAHVYQVKPAEVYLDDIKISEDGMIVLGGKAESEEAVYDFESKLKSVPFLRSPRVESTQPARLPRSEDATGFTLKAKFADSKGSPERNAKNG